MCNKLLSKYLLILFFLIFIIFPTLTLSIYTPIDDHLLACGTPLSATDSDGRLFLSDSSIATSHTHTASSPTNSSSLPLSRFARIFSGYFSYSFAIYAPGPHILRLHFYPFFNLSTANFNVSSSEFSLLTHFSTSAPTIKEFFFLDLDVPYFHLTFSPGSTSSFAFINAIEFFSVPQNLFVSNDRIYDRVLETVHRINVGGGKVTAKNDSLWRTWIPDAGFLENEMLVNKVAFSGRINYPDGGATRETAPDAVYGTARVMNLEGNSSSNFNLTWVLPVSDSSNGYLLRLHFCDIVSKALNELYFDVSINGYSAYADLDLSSQSGSLASPYYIDFLVDSNPSGNIRVSVGPSKRSLQWKINAILNGLEVMKINGIATFSQSQKQNRTGTTIILTLGCFISIVGLLTCLMFLFRWKRQKKLKPESSETVPWPPLQGNSYNRLMELAASSTTNLNLNLKIPFSEIILVTNNFDENFQIGSGGFGKVYKGVLRDGTMVAVKRFGGRGSTHGSQQGLPEFQAEILVLSKIRHRHLVSLIGYCEERSEMILVYEYMDKGPLRDHLYGTSHHLLSWKQRLEICIGSARGLHYLHTGSDQGTIIHRDVKSSNILLDENYIAKVADFGLSRSAGANVSQPHVSTGVKGSFGYLDPEYFKTQQLTDKSDVYSFGVVLLEVLCARPAINGSLSWEEVNLAEWGMKWQKKGHLERVIDPVLKGEIDSKSLTKFGEIVEKCLAQYGVDRPTMGDVLWNLESMLQLHESSLQPESLEGCTNDASKAPRVPSTQLATGKNEAKLNNRQDD